MLHRHQRARARKCRPERHLQRHFLVRRPLPLPAQLGESFQDFRRRRPRIAGAERHAGLACRQRDGFVAAQEFPFFRGHDFRGSRPSWPAAPRVGECNKKPRDWQAPFSPAPAPGRPAPPGRGFSPVLTGLFQISYISIMHITMAYFCKFLFSRLDLAGVFPTMPPSTHEPHGGRLSPHQATAPVGSAAVWITMSGESRRTADGVRHRSATKIYHQPTPNPETGA